MRPRAGVVRGQIRADRRAPSIAAAPACRVRRRSRSSSAGSDARLTAPRARAAGVVASATPRADQLLLDAVAANLVQLVDAPPALRRAAPPARPAASSIAAQQLAMIQPDREIVEPQRRQHVADRRQQLRFDQRRRRCRSRRCRTGRTRGTGPCAGPIGAPDRLNLIALEELRQLVLVLRDDARERDGQVVAQREVGFAARLVLAALAGS